MTSKNETSPDQWSLEKLCDFIRKQGVDSDVIEAIANMDGMSGRSFLALGKDFIEDSFIMDLAYKGVKVVKAWEKMVLASER